MTYYIGYIIIIAIQGIYIDCFLKYKEQLKKKIFLILSCIELIILTGLRADTVGADTYVYVSALDFYSFFELKELIEVGNFYPNRFEFGYLWITKICSFFNLHHTIFLTIIAMLIYIPTFKFFYNYSSFPFLSIAIYFGFGLFSYSLGIFRQFIALSTMLYGIKYIFERNLVKWSLIIAFSCLFHTSVAMCYIFYFIYKINFNLLFYATIILQPIIYTTGRSFLYIILSFFPAYFSYFGSRFDNLDGSMSMIILYDLILFACFLYNKRKSNKDYQKNFFINTIPLLCCIQTMAYTFSILGRAIPYFSIFISVVIPIILDNFFNKKQSLGVAIILGVLFVFLFIYCNIENEYILPFFFFWEK